MQSQITLSLLATLLLAPVIHAGFKIPRNVHPMTEIAKAQEEANEKGKALAFVYTDPGSS